MASKRLKELMESQGYDPMDSIQTRMGGVVQEAGEMAGDPLRITDHLRNRLLARSEGFAGVVVPADTTSRVMERLASWIEKGLYSHPAEVLLELSSGVSVVSEDKGEPIVQLISARVRCEAAKALLPYFERTVRDTDEAVSRKDQSVIQALNIILQQEEKKDA